MNTPRTEAELEDLLSQPTPEVVETMHRIPGDVLVLGVAGKMGPSLARMVRRASDEAGVKRRVIGVARFSEGGDQWLNRHGVETIRCDLLDTQQVARLPEAENLVFMAGRKFGSTGDESATWAMNAWLPAIVCQRYQTSRIVAFSTGNVYGLVPSHWAGSKEIDVPRPVGEYAMSALARERMFEYFSRTQQTPVALIRLNYACDLRYGVLVDLAQQILASQSIDLAMGYFNTIWQGDANAMTLRALEHVASPPAVFNVTGPEKLAVRDVCRHLEERLGKQVRFVGQEAESALLSDATTGIEKLCPPRMPAQELIEHVAAWLQRGGRTLNKPTHFESRDGKF